MNNDPKTSTDVTDPSDEAKGSAEFAEFAVTMKRAGVDWDPAVPLPARIPRGTVPPEPEPAEEVDDDFDDAITLELPVLPAFEDEDEAPWSRRRWVLARSFTWGVALLLVTVAIAVWWAMRANSSPMPVEPAVRGIGSAAAIVELPAIVVELDSAMSLPDDAETPAAVCGGE